MKQRILEIRKAVTDGHPLVHCITNPISINQCANAILAIGGRPIMAEHPEEVAEIAETADALVLNLGNITDVRMKSMVIAARTAHTCGIPVILDAVGTACSALRKDFARQLLDSVVPTVVKGNYSEINALYHEHYRATGVDADRTLSPEAMEKTAIALSRKLGTTVLATGKQDIITDGMRLGRVRNGTPMLSSVTGTGCMLGALCGTYLYGGSGFEAAVSGCVVLGICGELAQTEKGSGSFLVALMDGLSCLSDVKIMDMINLEVLHIGGN